MFKPLRLVRLRLDRLLGLLALASVCLAAAGVEAAELRVAAASSTQDAMELLAKEFERRTGTRVGTSYGSSAKLYHQIIQGAPFDLFFSADDVFPEKLVAAGRGQHRQRYATGRLALWAASRAGIDPAAGMGVLAERRVKKLAIANPRLAPYGMAARQAIDAAGLAAAVASKLVVGESAAQAAHFASTGGAEIALLPVSIALSPRLAGKGHYALVPASLYAPLHAEAVLTNPANPQAKAFLDFSLSPPGRAIWRQFGLERDP